MYKMVQSQFDDLLVPLGSHGTGGTRLLLTQKSGHQTLNHFKSKDNKFILLFGTACKMGTHIFIIIFGCSVQLSLPRTMGAPKFKVKT